MTQEQGFSYLHAIKSVGGNITVTDMLLYKEPNITLTSSANLEGYKTFYSADQSYEVDANTTIYKAASVSDNMVTIAEVEGSVIPAGTPVILKTSDTENYKITLVPTTATATGNFTGNLLAACDDNPTSAPEGYVFGYTKDDGLAFFAGQSIVAGDVYLPASVGAGVKRLIISFGDDATAINGVASEAAAQEGAIYNVAGQKVNAA